MSKWTVLNLRDLGQMVSVGKDKTEFSRNMLDSLSLDFRNDIKHFALPFY